MASQRQIERAAEDVLLGASMRQVAARHREGLIEDFGFRPDEVAVFIRAPARHLGDPRHGAARVAHALRDWVLECGHYEAWDALLTGFDVEGREALLRRGRVLFPGPLTRHWSEP